MSRWRLWLVPLLLLPVLAAPATASVQTMVGTAVVDVTPAKDDPQYLGGFENMSKPTAVAHDPLQVRAFVVRKGTSVAAFAILDVQGWFSGYQEGPYGISDVREQAAAWLSTHGSAGAGPQDIIVSSTHSHAAPTVMGIWGPTDLTWLKRVHDSTITAIERAASSARPAELWTADAQVGEADGSTVSQTDIYDGWTVDGNLPILWAREPRTGKTIGLYANVPIHADIVHGSKIAQMSADHIGMERAALDQILGGTSVLAMGTLGRQESIVQVGGLDAAQRIADFVVARMRIALASARRLDVTSIKGAEQHILVPGTNPILLGLIAANPVPNAPCLPGIDTCPIDRALTPPYMYGTVLGTWVTTIRIGDLLYVSEPGEAFPEVSAALRSAVPDARVRIVGMGQDQVGYYFPPEDVPFTTVPNESDHFQYLSGATLADQTVLATMQDAQAVGFGSHFVHPSPGMIDPLAKLNPGVQIFGAPAETPSLTTTINAAYNKAIGNSPIVWQDNGPIVWTYGDGTAGRGGRLTTHTWPKPGRYTVTASVVDVSGHARTSTLVVTVGRPYPPLPRIG